MDEKKTFFKRYELPQLPYKVDALEPYISKDIIDVHYNGHHKAYVNTTNTLLDRMEKITKKEVTQGNYDLQGVIRNLVFNINGHKLHSLYWKNMTPAKNDKENNPGGKLADLIISQYGTIGRFKELFIEAANSLPGGGWTTLNYDIENKNLHIMTYENHFMNQIVELPILLILDEFEHAYYLQYKNKRADYINMWWLLINWDDAENKLKNAENKL